MKKITTHETFLKTKNPKLLTFFTAFETILKITNFKLLEL